MSDERFKARLLLLKFGITGLFVGGLFLMIFGYVVYSQFRIDVPARHFAVLTRKTGNDLSNDQEISPDRTLKDATHKGLQREVLPEGRYFYNCYTWDWEIYPMVEIPADAMGVRIRLYGEDLPPGDFMSTSEKHKGIIQEVLKPGRYAINALVIDRNSKQPVGAPRLKNDYIEIIELWEPKVIPAGYKGIVTNLAGPMPEDPNQLLVDNGHRGPQKETLDEGTYYLNPYTIRINAIDTRSLRFDLSQGGVMMFPSKDGFPITLDGVIEFRVIPTTAAQTYVTYNDVSNDETGSTAIADEIINKVIMPNARAFCRLRGSNTSAREFIGGETRAAFQKEFQAKITETCKEQGIEIVQALITTITPPEAIAEPLRNREIAVQKKGQYSRETLQKEQEAVLATETALIEQKKALVTAEREIIKKITLARQEQGVALEQAERDKEVAQEQLEAAKDKAQAILAKARAESAVIGFENVADAAGWKRAVEAFGGDGSSFGRYVLYQKLAPGFKKIMTNTADSPLMRIFDHFADSAPVTPQPAKTQPVTTVSTEK